MTRDVIRNACELFLSPHEWIERDTTITIHGIRKYIFTSDGDLKTVIQDGKSYGPDGERPYVPPKR